MSKKLSVLLMFVLLLGLLVACGGSDTEEPEAAAPTAAPEEVAAPEETAPEEAKSMTYVFVPKGLPGNAWTAAYNVTLSKNESVIGTAGVNPAVGQEVTITVNGTPTDYYIYRVVKSVNATVLRMTP